MEILFRGFHADENGTEVVVVNGKEYKGKWVYGYYCQATRHWHKYGIHNDWIITSAFQNGGFFNLMGRYAVISETVGQYTGLDDKNGKRIFKGDRVKCVNYHGNVEGTIGYHYSHYYLSCSSGYSDEYLFNCSKIEVIGTIFDEEEK